MTDITELALRLKLEAHRAVSNFNPQMNIKTRDLKELVEALEKAQQRNGELETYSKTAIEFREAARDENRHLKLELEIAEKRIAELESRTVKLPDDEDGQAYGFGKWANRKLPATAGTMTIAYCEDAWRAAFEVFSSAAGINVEAE
ncbi:hypothetical protein [Klebsiella pneumoniae]|uniref:hypothetical protein n=1 Tax=Klebsiella pneumoniae TaxID=573 RepID=UPI0015FA02AB|nr:hypothetical protein [Klebsiella pneumoniae]MDD1850601.1 hypothetical protein [Klebsiella pneumoniae]MDD1862394.1 hypothetical protein [Klebsiella pneumoniae]WHB09669.1 hypothetical protein HX883_010225 [Klebsiella pneumoniae]